MISLPVHDDCIFLRELALELDGALGSSGKVPHFPPGGPSFDTFTTYDKHRRYPVPHDQYVYKVGVSQAILDVREGP